MTRPSIHLSINIVYIPIYLFGIINFFILAVLVFMFYNKTSLIILPFYFLLVVFIIVSFYLRDWYVVRFSLEKVLWQSVQTLTTMGLTNHKNSDTVIVEKTKFEIRLKKLGNYTLLYFKKVEAKSEKENYLKNTILKYLQYLK